MKPFQEQEKWEEGGDYITETETKHLKNNLPPGVLTFEKWIMATRGHEIFWKNRMGIFDKANFSDPGNQQSRIFSFHKEVQMVWKLIWESVLLCKPKEKQPPF